MVLRDMVLISRPDERPIFIQINLHHTQHRRVAGRSVERDPFTLVEVIIGECLLVQLTEIHVLWQIHVEICFGADSPACVLELFLMDVNWDVCAEEMFETAGVVEVQMSKHDSFDVFDVVSCRFNGSGQLHRVLINDPGEHIR